jgi:hypothetical protein
VMLIGRVISPWASSRTPAYLRAERTTPASRSFASSSGWAASRRPLSKAFSSASRLSGA